MSESVEKVKECLRQLGDYGVSREQSIKVVEAVDRVIEIEQGEIWLRVILQAITLAWETMSIEDYKECLMALKEIANCCLEDSRIREVMKYGKGQDY